MKNKKKYFLLIFLIPLIALSLLIAKCTSYQVRANRNVENCMKITLGMTPDEVVQIMGEPRGIMIIYGGRINQGMEILKFHYDAPIGAPDGVNILFCAQRNIVVWTVCEE